jgi:murein L,D-transpeptidase YafK
MASIRDGLPKFVLGGEIDPGPNRAADRILVLKSERRLLLYSGDAVLADYEISLGRSPRGPKRELGDGRTPEGRYRIVGRKRDSDYYRALRISYPSKRDRDRAFARGVRPGGAIMIHGLPNGMGVIGPAHRLVDWTDGCIAVTNEEMDEIWSLVSEGLPIEIRP